MFRLICLVLVLGLLSVVSLPLGAVEKAPRPQLAVFEIGALSEQPGSDLPWFQSGAELRDLITRIRAVAEDPAILGVVLTAGPGSPTLAQAAELRAAIAAVRESGREVHAFCDGLDLGQYLALAEADLIAMAPGAFFDLLGLHLETPYLAGLLERLGIEPQVVSVGEFKAAAEPFTRSAPSPEALAMEDWLLDDLYRHLSEVIATARGMEVVGVQAAIDAGPHLAADAVDRGLVDVSEHRLAFENRLRLQYGEDLRFVRGYGRDDRSLDASNPFALMTQLMDQLRGRRDEGEDRPTIAVVRVVGTIVDRAATDWLGGSDQAAASRLVPVLHRLVDDADVAAVVLRIDSPGGSASASEAILAAVEAVAAVKPVVVSMGTVAGSGGYYVACTGGEIFAQEATLTGSIGVLGGKLVTEAMWASIGIDWHVNGRGERHDLFSTDRLWTEDDRAVVRDEMTAIYELFEQRVTSARAGKLVGEFGELAGGRVFTGRQALARGLVDRIGGLHAALERAAELAELEAYAVRDLPRPANPFASLFGGGGGGGGERHLQAVLEPVLGGVRALEGPRADQLRAALHQLILIGESRLLLAMPPLAVRSGD